MINLKTITQGVETILNNNLEGYTIERNEERNTDPNRAARGSGWIGIYRGPVSYMAYAIGGTPWLAAIDVIIELQVASMLSGADVEDRLQDAEKEVLDVLNSNKKLNSTVDQTNGYDIEYEVNRDENIYFHSSIITIHAEARTS